MRRQTCGPTSGTTGRRGTLIAASAAVLCLGGSLSLTACAGGPGTDDGYTAVGAAGAGSERSPGEPRPPSGKVRLVPLDSGGADGSGPGDAGRSPGAAPSTRESGPARADSGADGGTGKAGPGRTAGPGRGESGKGGDGSAGTGGDSGSGDSAGPGASRPPDTAPSPPGGTPSPKPPSPPPGPGPGGGTPKPPGTPSPPLLELSAPQRAEGEYRWCEQVTVEFRNTGGSPARSGTVTFGTHIIGALGIDWATVTSSQPLPAPIDAGAAVTTTYTVCVDAWRVPLGMHIETRDVSAVWE
ncbi:hypothetical protein EES43_14780 [Streptomyces sp. ADI96-02]|uniref:hypothetical protein n=1 Tax=unclassified Streptomyces TaxID=2593676 RepID=UPI000F54EE6C|nr:hypothetical protein [Streptomyces sp. ADI96-02]RPK61872.1 hypothetical protein EES43_14780 [Streptomyces sp. ADI96-02]